MHTSTPTLTTDADTKQRCERCHAPEGSRHPVGNVSVKLNTADIGGRSRTLCSYCQIRAEIRAQRRPATRRRSIVSRLKKMIK